MMIFFFKRVPYFGYAGMPWMVEIIDKPSQKELKGNFDRKGNVLCLLGGSQLVSLSKLVRSPIYKPWNSAIRKGSHNPS